MERPSMDSIDQSIHHCEQCGLNPAQYTEDPLPMWLCSEKCKTRATIRLCSTPIEEI